MTTDAKPLPLSDATFDFIKRQAMRPGDHTWNNETVCALLAAIKADRATIAARDAEHDKLTEEIVAMRADVDAALAERDALKAEVARLSKLVVALYVGKDDVATIYHAQKMFEAAAALTPAKETDNG